MSGSLARQAIEDAEQGEPAAKAWTALLKRATLLLEEEHYCALQAPAGPLGPAAIAPWSGGEEGLSLGRERLPLPEDERHRDFLSRIAGGRLAYGYPTLVDGAVLLPMFVLKARLAADGRAVLLERPEAARLNVLALQRCGMAHREAMRLANELAEGGADFKQKLARVLRAVGEDPARYAGASLDDLGEDGGRRWVDRPILISAPLDAERRAAWNDLVALLKRPLPADQRRTALSGLFEPSPERQPPLAFELHALGPSQAEAVRAAMSRDVAVVEAAPGAGQMAFVANLIATATAADERVLYVACRGETARQMARHIESWIARDRRVAVRLGADPGAERDALVDSLYRLAREDALREAPEGQGKPQREKPTRKSLAELDRFSPRIEPIAEAARRAHEFIRERHLLQRALAVELGLAWTGSAGRRSPSPATREQLAEWRAGLGELRSRAPGGIGKLVKSMLGGKQEPLDVTAAVRSAIAKLPAEARAEMMALLADGSDVQALARCVDRIARFCEWRAALSARGEAIRKLVRGSPDGRALEMQAANHGAQKSAGAREIFKDEWRERLMADPLTLQKQVKALFDQFERAAEQAEGRPEGQASLRLAQAVRTVSSTLRLWTATPAQAQRLLPLEPALFDLVIVDEAERLDLAAALPLLYRARRAVVVGAMRGERRDCAAPHRRAMSLARTVADAPQWSEDPTLSLLGHVQAALRLQGAKPCRLVDHFRAHPFVADLLSRAFYGGDLKVRTNFRSLRRGASEDTLGLRWRHVEGRGEAAQDGWLNAAEVEGAAALLGAWKAAGVFAQAPRRSFAVVCPLPAQRDAAAAVVKRLGLPQGRIAVAAPAELAGRVVDYVLLTPGLSSDAPGELRQELAENEALWHDSLASARLGLHVVGDRSACLAAGGGVGLLASWAVLDRAEAAGEPADGEPDWFDPTFDAAFGPADEGKADLAAPLAKMLTDCGFAFQAGVEEGGLRLAYRVLTPQGGRYDVEVDPPLDELAARPGALDRLAERDKAAAALGYQVVRFEPEELAGGGEFVMERLQRLI